MNEREEKRQQREREMNLLACDYHVDLHDGRIVELKVTPYKNLSGVKVALHTENLFGKPKFDKTTSYRRNGYYWENIGNLLCCCEHSLAWISAQQKAYENGYLKNIEAGIETFLALFESDAKSVGILF